MAHANQMTKSSAHAFVEFDVRVASTEHHHGIAWRGTVSTSPQTPPHPERIHDADPSASLKQPFDTALGGIGFARSRGADDGHALV
jgi:hypothetical protein